MNCDFMIYSVGPNSWKVKLKYRIYKIQNTEYYKCFIPLCWESFLIKMW